MKPRTQSPDEIADFNHLILYSKNWYQRGNVIEDVKKILGERCALLDSVSDENMWIMLVEALLAYMPDYTRSYAMHEFLRNIFMPRADENGKSLTWFEPNCPLERAVKQVLTILGKLMVFTDARTVILNLGKPDPKILPLVDPYK